MDFEKKFDLINSKLENLMTIGEISSRDYVKISKQLIWAEDDIDLSNVMIEIKEAVIMEQTRKEKEREKRREERRK